MVVCASVCDTVNRVAIAVNAAVSTSRRTEADHTQVEVFMRGIARIIVAFAILTMTVLFPETAPAPPLATHCAGLGSSRLPA
jgi:hypothetical protein